MFLDRAPTPENEFRALILLGANTASYKFALGRALLKFSARPDDLVRLDDLAGPFGRALCEHLAVAPKQASSTINKGLSEACDAFNRGDADEGALRDAVVRHGFTHVIDAFHVLRGGDIEDRFFLDERTTSKGIRITPALRALVEEDRVADLTDETEARWRVVETGWELGLTPSVIEYDRTTDGLSIVTPERRRALRSCRSTLGGYQKGKCFFCFGPLQDGRSVDHVDHFFPWSLRSVFGDADQIWNLVLACPTCNLTKSDQTPALPLVERLHRRNEFYIASRHRLGGTIALQTGAHADDRRAFLQRTFDAVRTARIVLWTPQSRGEPAF